MVTTAPDYELIVKSDEFNEFSNLRAEIRALEQDLVLALTGVDAEAGFLPFEKVTL